MQNLCSGEISSKKFCLKQKSQKNTKPKTKGENKMKLTITPEDKLKGKVIPPGVYKVEVHYVEETKAGANAKNPGSQNWNVQFTIIDGEYKGVSVYKTFNETAPGFAVPFVEACGGKLNPKEAFELDFHRTVKTHLRVVVSNSLYNGTMKN